MIVNTAVGEMGLHYRGKDYLLRPSFYAINQIDTPRGIVDIYNTLRGGAVSRNNLNLSQLIMSCCCNDDISHLTGYLTESPSGKYLSIMTGKIDPADVIIMASRLLVFGLKGKPKRPQRTDLPPMLEFDATEFVGAAVAHLGVSANDAWQMTMVEFQRACEAMQPESEKLPTKKELDNVFKISDAVSEKLKKQRSKNNG